MSAGDGESHREGREMALANLGAPACRRLFP